MPRLLRGVFRLSFLFPFVVSSSAVALIWRFLLNKDLGLVNYWLGQLFGIERINWLGASAWAPIAVVIVSSWKTLGFSILVYIAGLQAIPGELREAAIVDGAERLDAVLVHHAAADVADHLLPRGHQHHQRVPDLRGAAGAHPGRPG